MDSLSSYENLSEIIRRKTNSIIGLHGAKSKWVSSIKRDGLDRPDAGWFILMSPKGNELRSTLALAVYFALSLRVCNELTMQPLDSGYASWFKLHPDNLPVLLFFTNAYYGEEMLNYYQCLVPGCVHRTAFYTKVKRASRPISANALIYPPFRIKQEDIISAEVRAVEQVQQRHYNDSESKRFIIKCSTTENLKEDASVELHSISNKIGYFCVAMADVVISRIIYHFLNNKI